MAASTQRHPLVEIEVGAALGPFHQMANIEAAASSAGLAVPTARVGTAAGEFARVDNPLSAASPLPAPSVGLLPRERRRAVPNTRSAVVRFVGLSR